MKHSKLRVASLALVLAMATVGPSYAKSDQDSTLTQKDIKQIKDLTEAIKKTSEDIDNIYEDNFKKEESKSIRTYSSDTKDFSEKPKIDDSNVTDDSKLTDDSNKSNDSNKSDDSKEEKLEAPKKEDKSKIENGIRDINKKEDKVDSNIKDDTSDGPLGFTTKDEAIKNAQKALENESSKNSYDIKKGVDGMYYYTLIEDKSKKDTTEPELKDDVIADVKESTSLVSEDVKSSTTYDYYAKNDIKLPARDASANAKTGVGSVSLALVTLVVSAAGFKASKKFK